MIPRPSAPILLEPSAAPGRPDGFAQATANSSPQQPVVPPPRSPESSSTCLPPDDPFPTALADLELVELHVLHSRIVRQLDREYRTGPAGPHPVSLDRAQELTAELDARQGHVERSHPVPVPIRTSSRAPATSTDRTPGAGPAQAPGGGTAGPRSPRRPAAGPRRHDEHPEDLFPYRDAAACGFDVRIEDLARLWPEDRIDVWHHEQLRCVGIVEQTAPALGVVWIHDSLDGYRCMLHLRDTELRYHLPAEQRHPAP